jgi:DNA invertase Pin-like site-specific DNA recombinase
MSTVAAYVRVSTREQSDNGHGIEVQKEKIRQWARLHDIDHIHLYEDRAVSGGTTKREGLQDLLDAVDAGEIETLVVHKADRLSRSLRDLLTLLDTRFEPNGVSFVSVTEPFDTSTPSGRLLLQMLGSFAEFERKQITERMKGGQKEKARGGGRACGAIPYGYRKTLDGIEPDPDTAPTVRRIFRLRDEGETLRAIADTLNAEGVPTKRGGNWHASTVSHILKNPKYRGRLVQTFDGERVEAEAEDLRLV